MILTIIKLFFFVFSSVGFWEILRRNTKIVKYFLPSLTIAIQTVVLFLAGLLNLLPHFSIVLYVVGIFALILYIIKDKSLFFLKEYWNIGFVFMGVGLAVLLMCVRGKVFTHYDNFSHWALVVKTMLNTDRFPNFEDTIIGFQEYPLGSAIYIYFFSKFIGKNESIQMIAQTYMMMSCILPLFLFVKKNKVLSTIFIFAMTNFILVYNISITDLLVDTLLPLVGICGMLYSFFYCKTCERKLEFFLISCYLIQLIQIKNSGIFFVLIIYIMIIRNMRREINKNIGLCFVSVLMPLISLLLWKKHCEYVFATAASTKHAMTIENYANVFETKTIDQIKEIVLSFLKFVITWKDVWMTFLFLFIIVGFCLFIREELSLTKSTLILSLLLYGAYQMGNLAMYLFSMPTEEALRLAECERYTKTILLVIIYLICILVLRLASCLEGKRLLSIILIAISLSYLCIFMVFSLGKIKSVFCLEEDRGRRDWIESIKAEYRIPNEADYCVLLSEDDSGYLRYLCKYVFQSVNISSVVVDELNDLSDIEAGYIIVYGQDNKIINQWVMDNFPDQYGNDVIINEG